MKRFFIILSFAIFFSNTSRAQLTARMLWDSAITIQSTASLNNEEKIALLHKAVLHDSLGKRYFFTGSFIKYGANKKDWDILKKNIIVERLKTTAFLDINGDGLPDVISYGFNTDTRADVTYIYINKKDSFSKIFNHNGLPTSISLDKKGRLLKLSLYMHFCCVHGFDYIYSFSFQFTKKKTAKLKLEDAWYTIHFENDKPAAFNMDKKAELSNSYDIPSYYPDAIPFPKGEARDAMIRGRVGLKKGTSLRLLYKLPTKEGDRYFIEAPFPESSKSESIYQGKGPYPTKLLGWVTADEIKF